MTQVIPVDSLAANTKKDTMPITAFSPAKINLFLHVHQLRADGFHHLRTYFQLIDLCDEIQFTLTADSQISVENPSLCLAPEKDLCYLAAKQLKAYAKESLGVKIVVRKNIPTGGGLGGGSSNAATVLVVLNKLWNLNLSQSELLVLGLQLGSDVPIFIYGFSTYAEGRGEIFATNDYQGLKENQPLIIISPAIEVSTAKIFQSPLLTKRSDAGKIRDLDRTQRLTTLGNDFESVVFVEYPEIACAAQRLSGVSEAYLTGTGACLYTVLDDVKKADTITRTLGSDYQFFQAKALGSSPLNVFK